MIHSMTGYGSGNFVIDGIDFHAEIKSYNHKFLDVSIKTPRALSRMENTMKKAVSASIDRGKVEVHISVADFPVSQSINRERMLDAYKFLNKVKGELKLKSEIGFTELFMLRDTFVTSTLNLEPDGRFTEKFMKQFSRVMKEFQASRSREGAELLKDLVKRLRIMENETAKVGKLTAKIKERQRNRLKQRVEEIVGKDSHRERFEQEITLLLDKLDISEEITRLNSHIRTFRKIIDEGSPAGKKLDFYCQEILREINTLSVKSQDAVMSEHAITMKAETEKIREQVQNVE